MDSRRLESGLQTSGVGTAATKDAGTAATAATKDAGTAATAATKDAGTAATKDAGTAATAATKDTAHDDRTARPRRSDALRTLGGAPFALRHVPVNVREETLGFRRFDPNGLVRDTTLYAEPIACAYATRAAVLGLPKASFGDVDTASLHALAHLFRTTLPAFLHHGEEDIEIVWLPAFGKGDTGPEPSIAFVDAHPGGAGFAEAITLDVLRACVRWSLALTRRCPAGCARRAGCLFCLQIRDCHSEPEGTHHLDRSGADHVLALLLGEEEAKRSGAPPKVP